MPHKDPEKAKKYRQKNMKCTAAIRERYFKKNPGMVRFKDIKAIIWSNKVKENYNWECSNCKSNKKLRSHHIFPWADFPSLRYNVKNGLCLCNNCHDKFHKMQGKSKYFNGWLE